MANKNKLLSILSDAEQEALYGLPDFDDAQRLEFLALNESELALACSRRGLHAQIYCIIQILKPSTCFSVSGGMMFRTTSALS